LLQQVHRAFDLDDKGTVRAEEIMALGQEIQRQRRSLGHKSVRWTKELHRSLLQNLGADRAGNVPEGAFVSYFDKSMTTEQAEFEALVEYLLACAWALRETEDSTAGSEAEAMEEEGDEGSAWGPDSAMSKALSTSKRHVPLGASNVPPLKIPQSPRRMELYRESRLSEVFETFDIDGSGIIDIQELALLGQAQQSLSWQQESMFSREGAADQMNGDELALLSYAQRELGHANSNVRKLLLSMDENSDGEIDEPEFCHYLSKVNNASTDG